MSNYVTRRIWRLVGVAFALYCLGPAGCAKPPEVALGEQVSQGQASVSLTSVRLHHAVLETSTGAQRNSEPVLEISLKTTNTGESPLRYDVGFSASADTQATAALLFRDTGVMPPNPGDLVAALQLSGLTYPDDPVTSAQTIPPGQSIDDLMLYSGVAPGTALILSVPPRVFGSDVDMPAWIRFNAPALEEPAEPAGLGETVELPGANVTLLAAEALWVPLTDTRHGEGFTEGPVMKLSFRVENTSEVGINLYPARSTTVAPPQLLREDGEPVARLTFPSSISVQGQSNERRQLSPGRTHDDFYLYELPPAGEMSLTIAGQRVGSTGLAEFKWNWQPGEAEVPEVFREPEEEEDEE